MVPVLNKIFQQSASEIIFNFASTLQARCSGSSRCSRGCTSGRGCSCSADVGCSGKGGGAPLVVLASSVIIVAPEGLPYQVPQIHFLVL